MKIELAKVKKVKAKEIKIGETCMMDDETLAIAVKLYDDAIPDENMDDFISDNFYVEETYNSHDWAHEHCSFVDLTNGEFFYIHRDTEVIPMPNAKIVVD